MDEPRVYCLTGIRADGSCAPALSELTISEAKRARLALEEAGLFSIVLIERNDDEQKSPIR